MYRNFVALFETSLHILTALSGIITGITRRGYIQGSLCYRHNCSVLWSLMFSCSPASKVKHVVYTQLFWVYVVHSIRTASRHISMCTSLATKYLEYRAQRGYEEIPSTVISRTSVSHRSLPTVL